ncbi:hypothetical protein [[Mycobacterium] nativiensis]|uniref:Uncharacterized protein n=1 Tax=[Mycobacterium] nativiensis TaxID=2855503 RepID=A0ABU5XTK3_9MYCO|nr:hypothetical protein [Mycolicibacter sp. MYC340]MEB3030341.1 hypothetical protein [Mycolicibacter sp. MYC340]
MANTVNSIEVDVDNVVAQDCGEWNVYPYAVSQPAPVNEASR